MENKDIMYDAYEVACLMETKRLCSDLLSALLRFRTTDSHNFINKELFNKTSVVRDSVEDLARELQIILCNIEEKK